MKIRRLVIVCLVGIGLLGKGAELCAAEKEKRNYHEFEIWHKLLEYEISPDGEWGMWRIQYAMGKDSLHICHLRSGKEYRYASASMAEFAANSRWVAFSKPGNHGASSGIAYQTCLLDLTSGVEKIFNGAESFSFTKDSHYLLLKGSAKTTMELNLYHLEKKFTKTIANLHSYVLDPTHQYLACLCERSGNSGSHLEIVNLSDFSTIFPKMEQAEYEKLKWDSWGLTLVKVCSDSIAVHPGVDIRVLQNIKGKLHYNSLLEDMKDGLPENMEVSKFYSPHWSADGKILFFSLIPKRQMGAIPQKEALDIWHWKDREIQSRQKNRYYANRAKGFLCAWWPEEKRWKQIADSTFSEVAAIAPNGDYVLIVDDKPYQPHYREPRRDWYLVHTATGQRTLLLENTILSAFFSREGKYVYYFKDKNWWAYHVARGKLINLTGQLSVEWSDAYYDGPIDIAPSFGVAGWLAGDKEFWCYDEYDIWSIDLATLKTKRLTQGRERGIVFRSMHRGNLPVNKEFLLRAKGRDGQTGVFRYHPKGQHRQLLYGPYNYSRLVKAETKGCYLFAREDNITSAELFYADEEFRAIRSVVATQRQSDSLRFRQSELIHYRNSRGQELKGALFYPVNYQEGKQYPMIVHLYELLSQRLNAFTYPSARETYNMMNFVLQGYFVFQPDIRYEVNHPGESAADCVIAAVREVLKRGDIDSTNLGLLGHSWGAYQTAYIISQTSMFAAAVAGAPLTNMVSMYNSIYWENGRSNQEMFETGQARFRLPWWEIEEEYIKNSPVFQAQHIQTPLLMVFGADDRAVDWRQGLELYITMRRLGKPCILLTYEGEGHTIGLLENMLDQTSRVMDYFNYYLKGEQPESWILEGKKYSLEN